MTKRFFSLITMIALAIGAWADVITVSSQTLWTFEGTSPNNGIYLHGEVFGVDSEHAASANGTFKGTSTGWSLPSSKVLASSQGCDISNIGNISAESGSGPVGSLAFNYSKAGKLYVVYGATSTTAGTFNIMVNGSSAYQQPMTGVNYSGSLGTRNANYTFTQAEAVVDLTGSGTVYLGGSAPYCIYAILFVPSSSINDDVNTGKADEVYDFQNWVKNVGVTGNPTRVGSDINISGSKKVKLAYYFSSNGKEDLLMDTHGRFAVDAYSEVGYDKNDDSKSALRNKANGAAFRAPNISIRNLKEKDHVTITSGVSVEGKAAVRFLSTNAHLKGIGTTPSADGTTIWENGKTWVMDADGNLDLKLGDTDYQAYIYKITITNRENVSAATFATATDNENHLVIIGGTTDEGTAKTYYTLDGTEPTTSSTEINGASVILTDLAASCTVKTLTVGSTGKTAYGRYNFIYVNTIPSASVAIDFEKAKANNEELIFADDAITVGWSTGTDSGSKKNFIN